VTAGRVEEDLSAALFWIVEPGQIRDVESRLGGAATSRPEPLDWYRPVSTAGGVKMGVQAPTAGTYLIEALRPHATYVNGVDSPTGPVNDTDTLACPLDYAAAAGHVELWRLARYEMVDGARLTGDLAMAKAEFERIVKSQWWYWDRPDRVRVRYPTARASQDQVVGGLTWGAWTGTAWGGMSALTWGRVLGA